MLPSLMIMINLFLNFTGFGIKLSKYHRLVVHVQLALVGKVALHHTQAAVGFKGSAYDNPERWIGQAQGLRLYRQYITSLQSS